MTCNYCRRLVNPPEESHKDRGILKPLPEYGPAKHHPWSRVGCNGHYQIKAVHFNSEERASPWQPAFNWYLRFPKGSCIKSVPPIHTVGYARCTPVYICKWTDKELKRLGYNDWTEGVPSHFEIVRSQIRIGEIELIPWYPLDDGYPEGRVNFPFCKKIKKIFCKQSDLPSLSIVPGRIIINLKEDEELLILPDVINYPLKRNPNAKKSKGFTIGSWHKKYLNPVYLPGSGYHHGVGPIERIEFAIAAGLKPGLRITERPLGLNPDEFRKPGLTPYIAKRLRWAVYRGSDGSYHNERGQPAERDPLRKREEKLLTKAGIPHESESKCDCGGIVRYDEHLALICDDCQSFYGYKMATDNFMNMGGEEEPSGDDSSWFADELESYDYDEITRIKFDRTDYRRIERLMKNLKEDRARKQEEEKHEIDYIKHDTREHKSEFLYYRISLLLSNNGDGMEQSEIHRNLEPIDGEVITYSAIKHAIKRMESMGRVKTDDVSTRNGKRVMVRLVAKT